MKSKIFLLFKFPNTIGKDIFIYVFAENGLVPAGNDMTREEIDENL